MYAEPFVASIRSRTSRRPPVELLDAQEDWFLARGVDKYEGWIHHGFLSPEPDSSARRSFPGDARVTRLRDEDPVEPAFIAARRASCRLRKCGHGEAVNHPSSQTGSPSHAWRSYVRRRTFFQGTSYLWAASRRGARTAPVRPIHLRSPWRRIATRRVATVGNRGEAEPCSTLHRDPRSFPIARSARDARGDLAWQLSLGASGVGRGGYATENLNDSGDAYVAVAERFLRAKKVL